MIAYWRDEYDWRVHEAELNSFDHYMTTVDGQRLHFVHQRSRGSSSFPLVMTHGWPGSIVEFQKVIGPLSDPASHGGDPADAFHVVLGRFTTGFWHNTVDEVGSTLKVQSERQAAGAVTATGKPQDIKFGNCEYAHRQDNKYCDEEEASKSIQ